MRLGGPRKVERILWGQKLALVLVVFRFSGGDMQDVPQMEKYGLEPGLKLPQVCELFELEKESGSCLKMGDRKQKAWI